jgi:hypothetical protein
MAAGSSQSKKKSACEDLTCDVKTLLSVLQFGAVSEC